ncbi:hypothetical protein SLA2020_527200 [Shorea laevis]
MFAKCHPVFPKLRPNPFCLSWKDNIVDLHLTDPYLVKIRNYPLLNFLLTTSIYIAISYRLFDLTNILKLALCQLKTTSAFCTT